MLREKLEKRTVFEIWVAEIDSRIIDWAEHETGKFDFALDFTFNSLTSFEKYLLKNFNKDCLKNPESIKILDGCVSYLGETFRRTLMDANWELYEDESFVYFNLPCVKPQFTPPFCPHKLLEEVIILRTGNVLYKKAMGLSMVEKEIFDAVSRQKNK